MRVWSMVFETLVREVSTMLEVASVTVTTSVIWPSSRATSRSARWPTVTWTAVKTARLKLGASTVTS